MLCYRDNKDLFLMKRLVQMYGIRYFSLFDKNHPPDVKVISWMALRLCCQLTRSAVSCYTECFNANLIFVSNG